jgi:acetyltransferase-like isoleucine patch superfamily enzyme
MLRVLRRFVRWVRLRSYDQYGIANHFRAQGASIGSGCRLLVRDLGSEPYLITIGDECLVSSDVMFVTHDGGTWVGRDRDPRLSVFGRITIGRRCFVGARSIMLPGTTLGDRCIVGAGAVCKGSYPAGSVIAGVPGRVIGTTEDYLQRASASSLDLPDAVFPLEAGDRATLRNHLVKRL